ncbi:DUF333 domain-containing protein [Vibrio tapetis]|uniref:Hemolysin n=1 Tax=Vibrio tapetis subsp. tapetis TaxID=1671868 RepID=A0A2N8ZMR1_9VIBR|nr:DUF333 domain-containing protein [Vibrio tapetis]SON53214.1 exported protein of unknown function [Vibrio tapetis subsp. tapetis]
MKKTILAVTMSLFALFSTNASANDEAPMLTMTNPAATFCIDQGGTLKSKETDAGSEGICVLSDGTEIGQWDYFNQNNNDEAESGMIGMANPASVYCEEQGGTLDFENGVGMCVFSDGTRIEEWEFYHQNHNKDAQNAPLGMANPSSVFCVEQGGTSTIVETDDGQIGMCVFKDGTEVEEWEYFHKHNK